MGPKTLTKIDFFIAGYGVVLCIGAASIFNMHIFFSVLTGAAIALVNWMASRWLGVRMIMTANKQKVALLLGFKTVVTLTLVGLVLAFMAVHAVAFLIGLSTLVLGVLSNSIVEAIAEGDKALREER